MGDSQIDFILVFAKQNEDKFREQIGSYLFNLKSMGFVLDTVISKSLKNRKFIKVHVPLETALNASTTYRIGLACMNPFHESERDTPPCFRLFDSELSTREPPLILSIRNRESVKGEKPLKPTSAERIMTAYEALRVTGFGREPNEFGFEEMKQRGIFVAAYPLHDGCWEWTKTGPLNDRQLLNGYWGSFGVCCKIQPIEVVQKYFGPEVGFYCAMLGLYMAMLLLAAIFGLISVLAYSIGPDTRLDQICHSNHCICPHCMSPKICNFSFLTSSCKYSRLNYVFDNNSTMPFSILMSFWGVIFVSLWERKQCFLRVAWNIPRFLRPDFAIRQGYRLQSKQSKQSQHSPRKRGNQSSGLLKTHPGKSPRSKRGNFWVRLKTSIVDMYANRTKNKSKRSKADPITKRAKPVSPTVTEVPQRSNSGASLFSLDEKRNPLIEERNENEIPYLTYKERLVPVTYLLIGVIAVAYLELHILISFILYRILLTEDLMASAMKPPLEAGININFRGSAIIYAAIIPAILATGIIIICDFVIDKLAICLTNLENHRTQRDYDHSYTIKLVIFSFINNFTIPIYLALFRGIKFTHPGDRKMWEFLKGANADFCDVSGCLADLWIFITIIIITKSIYNVCSYVLVPIVCNKLKGTVRLFANAEHPQWELDHDLPPLPRYYFTKLNKEFLIQYGFVVCFAPSFPLLPLIVLVLNIIELRIHAMMLVRFYQRFVPRQACQRDLWKKIMFIITLIAALINAFILGTTLNWADRQYYKKTVDSTLNGYIEASISKFAIEDYGNSTGGAALKECYYVGRRVSKEAQNNTDRIYELSDFYYETYCARYIFTVGLFMSSILFGLVFRLLTSQPQYLLEKIVYQEKTHAN